IKFASRTATACCGAATSTPLWYGVFNWFWFWLWREQPLRESLSLLYRELADYCEAKYSLLTQHTDPSTALPPMMRYALPGIGNNWQVILKATALVS
ncbi:FUSC family membrane protein, partial [Klebsiella pneumoniae]|uniref:FUSC family membrane protein n=1 Tax=Klebsiella pneumoniae TaxID=573 RepID=UPI00272E26F3